MKKIIGLMLISCLSISSLFAKENRAESNKKEERHLYKQEKFNENKTKLMNKLDEKHEERKGLFQEKKDCINNAQTQEELKLCKNNKKLIN